MEFYMAFGFLGKFNGTEKVVWKCEGGTDALSILSLDIPDDHAALCNGNGAQERPTANTEWFLRMFASAEEVFVIHDCDIPGQEGAIGTDESPGWARAIAQYASRVRNVVLPYPITETKGKDVRDWIKERLIQKKSNQEIYAELLEYARTFPSLGELAAISIAGIESTNDGDTMESTEGEAVETEPEEAKPKEAKDDPHRLAGINIDIYRDEHGGALRFWRQQWWKYRGGRYREVSDSEIRAKVTMSIKREFDSLWREENEAYEAWVAGDNYDEKKDKGAPVVRQVKDRLVNNVINVMKSLCLLSDSVLMPSWIPTRKQPHYLATSNGILDLDAVFEGDSDNSLMPHSPDWFSPFRLDYPFDPLAKCPEWLRYLDMVMEGDIQRINILQEWAGYLLTSVNDHQRFLVLEGEGGNGKTVYFTAITAMLGEENVSHVTLENFGGRFELASTIGKAANISGDAGEIDNVAEGVLKQFCGGDIMQFDRKNREPISIRPTAKLMVAWNSRPRIRDKSMGVWRRMLVVPFNYQVTADKRIRGMDRPEYWMTLGEVPGILWWAIQGLDRLKSQGVFTSSDVCQAAMNEYREEVNPTLRFLNTFVAALTKDEEIEAMQFEEYDRPAIPANQLYGNYKSWCEEEGVKPLSRNNFGSQVKRQFGDCRTQRRNGIERYYAYRNLRYTDDALS